jgi:hypothetical protein
LDRFSGSLAFNAGEMKKGMMLALDEVNAEGGAIRSANRTDLRRYGVQTGQRLGRCQKNWLPVTMFWWSEAVTVPALISPPVSSASIEEVPVVVAIAISPTITNRGYDLRLSHESQQPYVFGRHE